MKKVLGKLVGNITIGSKKDGLRLKVSGRVVGRGGGGGITKLIGFSHADPVAHLQGPLS